MSTKRYQFSGVTANGDYLSPDMSWIQERGYVAYTFYSDEALTNLVTPTGGTINTTVSENGDVYGSIPNNLTSANAVGPLVEYVRPNWAGSVRILKVHLENITGAAYFKCVISRFGA